MRAASLAMLFLVMEVKTSKSTALAYRIQMGSGGRAARGGCHIGKGVPGKTPRLGDGKMMLVRWAGFKVGLELFPSAQRDELVEMNAAKCTICKTYDSVAVH